MRGWWGSGPGAVGRRVCAAGSVFPHATERIGCSGVTCWRRLRDWTEAGVWPRLHEALLAELRAANLLEMDDAAIDGSHVRALKGGITRAPHRSTGAGRAASTM